MNKKTFLPHLTNEEVAEAAQRGAVLLLPIGTVESNGPHQLLGCDYLVSERLAQVVAERTGALRMPTLHYGVSELHDSLPGTFGLTDALFGQLLEALMTAAARNGFQRALLFNCHRHNHQPIEILARAMRRAKRIGMAVIDPLEVARDLAAAEFRGDPPGAIGHGGEPLASLMCHLYPDDVRLDRQAGPDLDPFLGLAALSSTRFRYQGSKVGLFPDAREINASGAWADLTHTSGQRGAVAFERVCDFAEAFVRDFAAMPIMAR
ncbi:creatininase family protein [Bordetella sp. BOR01]|uniref:creatininase family protein n=1 Tax=Bordetella sp. BOR01 TaxID=2854779 RepID=UPI001C45C866|nr:creatininase family protein [Bordetella sp. BOR01]MBV7484043.1 creatininase family protein [Bordetella sp. BOR01]